MKHKGRLTYFPPGSSIGIHVDPVRAEAIAATNHKGMRNSGHACDACGDCWYDMHQQDEDEPCELRCKHCEEPLEQHVNGKCLFGPTVFTERRYTVVVKT